jgi:hypothetical protein
MVAERNAVDLAQKLVSYLDSSNGDVQPLFSTVETLRAKTQTSSAPFDLDAFETHITAMDAALDDAWNVLTEDEDEPPLMSETYIDWNTSDDDEAMFRYDVGGRAVVQTIHAHLVTAIDELGSAWDVVWEGDDVQTGELEGDFGVYESLLKYIDYVYSQVRGMVEMAYKLDKMVPP